MAIDPDEETMRAFDAGELVADRATIERCAEIAARDLIATYRARFASSAPSIVAGVAAWCDPAARGESLVAAIAISDGVGCGYNCKSRQTETGVICTRSAISRSVSP